MKTTRVLKPRIKQNIYGNWYGYLGNHRAEMFFGCGGFGGEQERQAQEWLAQQQELYRVVKGGAQ
jgi:hypothetical protein